MSGAAIRLWSTLVATLVAIGGTAALGAQQPAKPAQECGGPLAMILVTVVDGKGAPVTNAKVEVTRERDGKAVPEMMADMSPTGEYPVMDDMALPMVSAEGTRFVVRASRGKQVASIVLRIGRTAGRCHVRRLGEEVKIVLGR